MINSSLIGYGKWGKNIFNTIIKNKNINLEYIAKKNTKNFTIPNFKKKIVQSYSKAINNRVDAVFIATPSESHFKIAKKALIQKKHVFIEKPVCLFNKDFIELKKIALKNSLVLHINYIHLYNENLIKLKNLIKKISQIDKYKIKILFGNNGPVRKKISPLMDYGPHIFSIVNFLLNTNKYQLKKKEINFNKNKTKANIYLKFKYKKTIIESHFGNNFKNKKMKIEIETKKNIYNYLDKYLIIKNLKKKIIKKNYQKKTPLENSVNNFLKSCNKKLPYRDLINDKITKNLENLENKLFD